MNLVEWTHKIAVANHKDGHSSVILIKITGHPEVRPANFKTTAAKLNWEL